MLASSEYFKDVNVHKQRHQMDRPSTSKAAFEHVDDDEDELSMAIVDGDDTTTSTANESLRTFARQLDDTLQAKASQHHMSALNVKSFLRVGDN
jgi:hypothetical protein